MHQPPDASGNRDEDWNLGRNRFKPVSLPKKEEARRKTGEVVHPASDRLREASEEGKEAKRDDERWKAQPRDKQRVQSAGERADAESRDRDQWRQIGVTPEFAKHDCAKPQQRADREIDSPSEDDRRHYEREQANFDRLTQDLHQVAARAEILRALREDHQLDKQDDHKQRLEAEEVRLPRGR